MLKVIKEYWSKTTELLSDNIDMIKKLSLIAIIILLVFTSIFSIYNYISTNKAVAELNLELELLTSNLNKIKEGNSQSQNNVFDEKDYNDFKLKTLTDLAITKLMLEQFNKAVFNVADSGKGFARIDTNTGMFFLILDNTEQVEDGYKLSFRLGNPQNCVYNGSKLKIRWGEKYNREDKSISYEEWEKTLSTSDHSISDLLRPGEWSNFDITLSPAKIEDMKYLEIKMQTDQIIMQKSSTK